VKPQLPNPALIPFFVAVTGHRDLRPQDLPSLREEIRNVFDAMRSRMPSTPVVLLSGLAEGADQFVAEVALERGLSVVAVLPMPLDIYKEQMAPEIQGKLDELLALSTVTIMLPLEGRTPEKIRTSEVVRASCYEALGKFLALHGQALIALWDGTNSNKRGGTSSVVHHMRTGRIHEDAEEAESRCGVVYHVMTPRMSSTGPAHEVATVTLGCEPDRVDSEPRSRKARHDELQSRSINRLEIDLERFNSESLQLAGYAAVSGARLIVDPDITLSPIQDRLQTLYRQADAISVRSNSRRKIVLSLILFTAIAGTLFYGVHGEMLGERVWLWFSFPFFVTAALVLHRFAFASHVEERYLDARALAEALRVQFFWDMAGIRQSVDRHYLFSRRTELDWIRLTLRNAMLLNQDQNEDSAIKPNYKAVLEHWVKDQQKWYSIRAERQSRSVDRREKVSRYGLIAAVGWSILIPASMLIPGPWHNLFPWNAVDTEQWVFQAFHVALAVPALLAAAYRLWIEQSAYKEQSREYRFMEKQFAHTARALEKHLDSPAAAEKLLLELGIEALKENGRWLLLHRERPLEVMSTP
jgi:hypothetical protein